MSELHPMETRRRSRSKTPFLRSACDHENCEHAGEEGHDHHKKKAATSPKVQTITEEREETSMRESRDSAAKSRVKLKSSDYSEDKRESKIFKTTSKTASGEGKTKTIVTTTSTVLTKSSMNTPGPGISMKSSGVLSSTPKSLFEGKNSQKEISQNVINAEKEKSFLSSSFSRIFSSKSFSNLASKNDSQNGDITDHLAYREYKSAGEYWNKTPKTDYTYSEYSKDRRVLAPGIVGMPNMSRRGLSNHNARVEYMIQNNPQQEEFIRRRYEYDYARNRQEVNRLTYESGDEVDTSVYSKNNYYQNNFVQQQRNWLQRSITAIFTIIATIWSKIVVGSNLNNSGKSSLYRTRMTSNRERGFFGTIGDIIFKSFVATYRYIYTFVSSVLYLDTVLLQSSRGSSQAKKRFLLALLILLPFLLLAAYHLSSDTGLVLLPVSLLSSLKASFSSTTASLRGFLQIPDVLKRFSSSSSQTGVPPPDVVINNLKDNLQHTMSEEEYNHLLDHINSYVRHLVEFQVQEKHKELLQQQQQQSQTLTSDQIHIIVKIMHENLEAFARRKRSPGQVQLAALSEADIQYLVDLIKGQMLSSNWPQEKPIKLSKENLEEMKELIIHHIQVNNESFHHYIVEAIDIEALLKRILKSPHLSDFIDSRITFSLRDQISSSKDFLAKERSANEEELLRIHEMNKEIDFIKLSLTDKLAENADLQQSVLKLQASHDDLLRRFEDLESANNQQMDQILADLESNFTSLKEDNFGLLNKQVKMTLVEILGLKTSSSDKSDMRDVDIKEWMHNIFVAKDFLAESLLALQNSTNQKILDEVDRSSMFLMRQINERLKSEILASVEAKQKETSSQLKGEIRAALSEEEVKNIVKSVLAIYDADKTGLVDFALESAGGSVLSTRCTENYQTKSAQISIFGIPLWFPTNTPRVAISPNVQPGECWAFQGFPGFLVLKLNSLVYVTGFTLEHIPKSLSPTGRIDSAPRNFTVWGLTHEKDHEPILFGEYEYVDNGASLQYFPVQNKELKRPYEIVELRIETNHGHPQYTCLYRFRVHGKPPTA